MILLGHGSGGRLSHKLLKEHFLPSLKNPILDQLQDSAVLGEIALTTDAYVVKPRFFPGGDLGRLAISGTVNDLYMVGAEPLGLATAFIIEEGFPIEELDRLVHSISVTSEEAKVSVVAGDTKVVPRNTCDGVFITTSGVGRIDPSFAPSPTKVRHNDLVIVSGTIADHGIAVLISRESIPIKGNIKSDVAPLGPLVRGLQQERLEVHAMRDPTRGGVAQSLIEIAETAQLRIVIEEKRIPIKPQVLAVCELLGIDPLYVANEGKLVLIIPHAQADRALEILKEHPLGRSAQIIGRVERGQPGLELETTIGGNRRLLMHSGELLPRIC